MQKNDSRTPQKRVRSHFLPKAHQKALPSMTQESRTARGDTVRGVGYASDHALFDGQSARSGRLRLLLGERQLEHAVVIRGGNCIALYGCDVEAS